MDEDEHEHLADIIRSGIDSRVWVVVLPDVDTWEGAMQASTSIRIAKRFVERHCARYVESAGGKAHWVPTDDGCWEYRMHSDACEHCTARSDLS